MRRACSPVRAAVTALVLTLSGVAAHAQYSQVVVRPATERHAALIRSLDNDHVHGGADGLRLAVSHEELAWLRREGVPLEVEIANLEEFYAERSRRGLAELRDRRPAALASAGGFRLGSVGGFLSIDELEEDLERMAERFPRLAAAPQPIGTTHEGRTIYAIRISARDAGDASVPEALFTALHHSREPAGMMSLVYTMWTLLEGHGSDPEITWLLDNRALWFIPLVNPDGYAYNARRFPSGGGLWRKNMRDGGVNGVDLNRNYGPQELWDHPLGGSSTNVQSDTYRGPAPFSEPETQAVRDFCLGRRFAVALNHHTFSNLFIQPAEIIALPPADSVYYGTATHALAGLAGYAPGNSRVTVGYSARGTSDDWMYAHGGGAQGAMFSWTPESGNVEDGFWPAPQRIEPIVAWNHRMNMGIAWAAGAAPIITARSWRADASGPVLRVTVTNVGRQPMSAPAMLAIEEGASTEVPPLAPAEALTFELPVPEAMRTLAATPRPVVALSLSFEGSRLRDSVAPIAHAVTTLFADDFEAGVGRWDPGVAWGAETTIEHTRVASDSPGGDYEERRTANALTLRYPIALEGYTAAELFFDARYVVEARSHNAAVQVRREPSLEWEAADCEELQLPIESDALTRDRFRGDVREWRRYRVPLDRHLGHAISVRFVLEAQNSQFHYTFDGIQIDNVEIVAARPIASAIADDAETASWLRVSPNPFSASLAITLEHTPRASTVELYDDLGALVRTASIDRTGTIATGDLPAGGYTVVVRSGADVARKRVVLVR